MKLIRLFGIIILICLIWGLGMAFDGEGYKPIDEVVEESSNEKQTISFSESEEENISNEVSTENVDKIFDEDKSFDISTKVVDKSSTTSSINKSVDSSDVNKKEEQIIVPKNEEITQNEEVKDTKQESIVEEQTQIIVENNVVEETQEKVEETKKEEDNELEILMKQVEYDTYEKCMDIGFEKAIEDPVGILGFSCPYIAYKGKIIGYRLQLDYTNPMEN